MYERDFSSSRDSETSYAAERIISVFLENYPLPLSAIDVGCGVGTFLSVLKKKGVKEVRGIDGEWVDRDLLAIAPSEFREADLRSPPPQGRKYDLAICLEVAEHLPRANASDFVKWLCSLSDVVLFSAAIPGQGGINHHNEAWLSYWAALFLENGLRHNDAIRPVIWEDTRIAFWYRQNCIVFDKDIVDNGRQTPLDIVHPELFRMRTAQKSTYGWKTVLRRALRGITQTGDD